MKYSKISSIVLMSTMSVLLTGCFDTDSRTAAETLNANAAMDIASVMPSMDDDGGNTEITDEDYEIAEANTEISKTDPNTAVAVGTTPNNPEQQSAFDKFMSESLDSVVPTTLADKGGVSHTPMASTGKILLKPYKHATTNVINYNGDNSVVCADQEQGAAFYCSDEYLMQVQQSKNRIKLKDGSEIVLTQEYKIPNSQIVSYVNDGVAHSTKYTFSDIGEHQEVAMKYARVNNDACFFGVLKNSGVTESNIYNCYKPSDKADYDIIGSLSWSNKDNIIFTDYDLDELLNSSYESFSSVVK